MTRSTAELVARFSRLRSGTTLRETERNDSESRDEMLTLQGGACSTSLLEIRVDAEADVSAWSGGAHTTRRLKNRGWSLTGKELDDPSRARSWLCRAPVAVDNDKLRESRRSWAERKDWEQGW